MPELIDRLSLIDKLDQGQKKALDAKDFTSFYALVYFKAMLQNEPEIVKNLPTIDPEVRRGHWIPVDGEPYARCSYCGEKHYGCSTPYCDMCGAYMRKATDTNDGGKGGND